MRSGAAHAELCTGGAAWAVAVYGVRRAVCARGVLDAAPRSLGGGVAAAVRLSCACICAPWPAGRRCASVRVPSADELVECMCGILSVDFETSAHRSHLLAACLPRHRVNRRSLKLRHYLRRRIYGWEAHVRPRSSSAANDGTETNNQRDVSIESMRMCDSQALGRSPTSSVSCAVMLSITGGSIAIVTHSLSPVAGGMILACSCCGRAIALPSVAFTRRGDDWLKSAIACNTHAPRSVT